MVALSNRFEIIQIKKFFNSTFRECGVEELFDYTLLRNYRKYSVKFCQYAICCAKK